MPSSARPGTSWAATPASSRPVTRRSSASAATRRPCCPTSSGSRRGSACSWAPPWPPLLGALIGYLGFRFGLRGFYFVLLTVAFAEVCRILVSNIDAVGGALGLYITFTGNPRQFQFQDQRVYYYIALAFMLLATGVAALIERRRFGMYLSAIREDETACEALGVNTFKYKMLAMLVSSFLTGLGGTFYAFYLFSLQPTTVFGIPLSVEIIIRPIIGGSGTLIGPILGSFILTPLGRSVALLLRPERPARRAPHRLRHAADRRGAVPAPGRVSISAPPVRRTQPPRTLNSPPGPTLLLQVSGLSRRFGGLQAVKDLSFTVGEGEIVGLIGPNGAGKTTAFALISGFLAPDAGEVTLPRTIDLRGLRPHEVNALGTGAHVSDHASVPAPERAAQRDDRHPRPPRRRRHGRARGRGRCWTKSGWARGRRRRPAASRTAERKRLELARALGTEPALLLLDEVMSGLDRVGDRADRRAGARDQPSRRGHPLDRARHAGGDVAGPAHRRPELRRTHRRGTAGGRGPRSAGDRGLPGRRGDERCSGLTASRRATATSWPCGASRSRCAPARSSRSSAATARARPPRCGPCRACCRCAGAP